VTTIVRARRAQLADTRLAADLHATQIEEGFLSALGAGILRPLYARIIKTGGVLLVAEDDTGPLGFAAATADVGRLYKSFVARDGVVAGIRNAPALLRSWRRVLETLRYPADHDHLPVAEILAVAVAPAGRRRGIGRLLVDETLASLTDDGIDAVRVTAGADNASAIALYESCGFTRRAEIEVHRGTRSIVLTWARS
jgi:ribosomal protein S18 acetylase RimI-like enzyme